MPSLTHSPRPFPRHSQALSLVALLFFAGCGGSDLQGGQTGIPGEESSNPATGMPFIVDENQGGAATRLQISEIYWGRLVNVHQLSADFNPSVDFDPEDVDPDPVFVDWVINQNVSTNNITYILETNAITRVTRLIILAHKDSENTAEQARFRQLLDQTQQNFPFVVPKNDDGSSPGPYSFVPRNSCVVIRFNDCLLDDGGPFGGLADTVKVFNGLPPTTPFDSRILFDPNHGALIGGEFHSTRVLVSATVSVVEAALIPGVAPNALGFSASQTDEIVLPSVSVRIPTRIDFGSTQFAVLRNLRGNPLDFDSAGPRDSGSPTLEVVRAMRSGNALDPYNGFLRDETTPDLLGAFPITIDAVVDDPMGTPGLDYILNLSFTSSCETTPLVGDVFRVNGVVLEVTNQPGPPAGGSVMNVDCRAAAVPPAGVSLTGTAEFINAYDPEKVAGLVTSACWVGFSPAPATPPALGVNPGAQATLLFSEPMDPDTLSPFQGFMLVSGGVPYDEPAAADEIVVGPILRSPGLDGFSFDPVLPLSHEKGTIETYHLRLRGATDLAGNALNFQLPFVNFVLDPAAATAQSGGISFRFDSTDEMGDAGPDIRGQVIYQFGTDGGRIVPREPITGCYVADRNNPVPAVQLVNPLGVREPLVALGSKLQFVWRYADFDFTATDETKYDLDIVGLNWAPRGGLPATEHFESFEMRLSHSRWLPEDAFGTLAPGMPPVTYPCTQALISGLVGNTGESFEDNILIDPRSPQQVVHPSSLGYRIDQTERFVTPSNTVLMPYPYDPFSNVGVGGIPDTFTWRDTSVQARGGMNSAGIPQAVEMLAAPLGAALGSRYPGLFAGGIAGPGQVPSYGLPLLVEVRCFPSDSAVGLNTLDVSLALAGFAVPVQSLIGIQGGPAMRAYSSGGIDDTGTLVTKNPNDPDQDLPSGGFNPFSMPTMNARTLFNADNNWYPGQIDTVIRVSRAHSIWLDAGDPSDFRFPILLPNPDSVPEGTSVVLEYRGATNITGTGFQDADNLDAYGDMIDPGMAQVTFLNSDMTWKSVISEIDGASFFQIRFTFINNIVKNLTTDLDAVGIPFSF